MSEERRKLTDEEVAKLDVQQRALKETVERQCLEQVKFLIREISADPSLLGWDATDKLTDILGQGGFKVGLFRVTDANVSRKLMVQVVYEIDDDLEKYLRQPAEMLPEALRGFLEGGVALQLSKPVAEDLMPQTGKTKAY